MNSTVSGRDLSVLVKAKAPTDPLWWSRWNRRMADGSAYEILSRGHWFMPYLKEPLRAWKKDSPRGHRQVWSKCAQVGCTEAAISTALWFLDVCREGVMYGLPSEDQVTSFVQVRVNATIRASSRIASALRETDNTDVKLMWGKPLYFRGSIARSKLREIPVGLLVRDEFGEMNEVGREMMLARLDASERKWILDLGNPRFPETGIDAEYQDGDRSVWKILCECGADEEPRWPESVKMTNGLATLVCPACGSPVDRGGGRWVPTDPDARYRSFRLSQLISPAVEPWELVAAWESAQGNETRLQEFWNSKLGLPYAPEGARITEDVLSKLPLSGEMMAGYVKPTCMGVDVGAVLHVIIRRVEGGILWAGTCNWIELDRLMGTYNVQHCGIDAMPETTMARQFAQRWPGRVRMVRYLPPTSQGKRETREEGVPVVQISRTEALDLAFARLLKGEEQLPTNMPAEVRRHWGALTRQIVKTGKTEYAAWVETGPDHFAHSLVYSELVRDDRAPWEIAGLH